MSRQKKDSVRHLPIAVIESIKQRQQEIERQKFLAHCMEVELERYVEQASGVNLRTEQWQLDLDHARLTRITGETN